MTGIEYTELLARLQALREVAKDYRGKTIDNIIQQMEARVKEVRV